MPIPTTAAQIAAGLMEQIENGELKPGQKLPTYEQIRVRHGVAHTTAAKAILHLRLLGLVVGVPGKGVYVIE